MPIETVNYLKRYDLKKKTVKQVLGRPMTLLVTSYCFGWRGGCVDSVSARSLQTEPTARLWVRVRSTDVYRVISLGKIFTPTRLG